jgi:phospholipase/lecithinase/hemolysin
MRRLVSILSLLIAFTSATLHATATSFDALYVFGDSYCDVGNVSTASGGAIPGPFYYNGRFSNGPIWVDHVAGFLGVPLTPSLLKGTDYAFGGAEVTQAVSTPQGTIPSVPQQVLLYLSTHGNKADPNALYILEGGGNDILNAPSGTDPNALGYQIAVGIASSELLLRQAGAKHFVIPNLFNVGILPAATNPTFATAASNAANKWLNELLSFEMLLENVRILRMDVFSLMSAVFTDPTHFGFVNITAPCLNTALTPPVVCADPDHTLFWDVEHPTVFGHSFFAVVLENVLATQNPH